MLDTHHLVLAKVVCDDVTLYSVTAQRQGPSSPKKTPDNNPQRKRSDLRGFGRDLAWEVSDVPFKVAERVL